MKSSLVTIGAVALWASLSLAAAAEDAAPVRGTWKLSNWTINDSVRLTLSYRKASSRWDWSSDQELAELHGLTSGQLHAVSTPASFTLERDPGVFFFEGTILLGIGRGEYRFLASPSFAAKLAALGYDAIDEADASLMIMAVRDVSLAYAADVKRLGLKDVAVQDLVRFRDHGISIGFIRELVASGYPGLTGDGVIRLRDHGVSPSFVKALVDAGRSAASVDEIIRLNDHGVDATYIARIQSAGFKDVTVDQIVRLHDHGVD
jgi:hypothetical protein